MLGQSDIVLIDYHAGDGRESRHPHVQEYGLIGFDAHGHGGAAPALLAVLHDAESAARGVDEVGSGGQTLELEHAVDIGARTACGSGAARHGLDRYQRARERLARLVFHDGALDYGRAQSAAEQQRGQ